MRSRVQQLLNERLLRRDVEQLRQLVDLLSMRVILKG
jgi:hypothetical protein